MTTHDAFEDLADAYALEALDAEERRAFEAHLATCAECQRVVADGRRVAASLGASTDATALPPGLRARTLARAIGAEPGAALSERRGARIRERPSPRWITFAAAAGLLMSVGLGFYAARLRSDVASLNQLLAQAATEAAELGAALADARLDSARFVEVLAVLDAPDLVRVDLQGQATAPAAIGRAYVSASAGLIFSAAGLPQLDSGRTYQLWVVPAVAGSAPVGVGTFSVDATGRAQVTVPLPGGVPMAAVAVTNEPAGGSASPTLPILLMGARS